MGAVKSCCYRQVEDKLMVTKMDLSHCGCLEVPPIVFNAERCIETLILSSNQISSLPPQLFHCQELKHLNLNDNCLSSIPPAIGSFPHLISLKLDKNNLQELPDNLKMCKKLKRISLSNNPWKQMPNIVTQLISLEELYINDCELNYLPASVGRLAKLKIMELRNNNLCNLPLSMTRLELLTRLDISDNEFTEFPACIPKLKSLKELLLDNNDIEEIIDIKNLVHLEHVDASYNHLSTISESIGCCTHINMLNLSFNYIEQLPNSIGNITHLQTLHLEMNELTEIPKSIGKLSHLEELNLCNNKLYSLPNTIGLLRNLRNLNVSRNIIEEFPPEIGSCTKLSIINAAYNRLQVLPSEIGYLNNLKVLDLVGNFLMYLPITIINIRGVRAIWLSANQNVPLIPFTEDLNIASGERFLTNIALPQLGEIPLRGSAREDKMADHNEKSSSWNKKIRFAEDEDIPPGKLHRTPTPFPKELRAPNRKHPRSEEPKPNDNYVNVIDGKVSEQEVQLLQPPSVPVAKTGSGLLNASEGCVTRIREANIRRNNKEVTFENPLQNYNVGSNGIYVEPGYGYVSGTEEKGLSTPDTVDSKTAETQEMETSNPSDSKEANPDQDYRNTPPATSGHSDTDPDVKPESNQPKDEDASTSDHSCRDAQDNFVNSIKQQVIYSNLVNNGNKSPSDENSQLNPQKIREMYHNDIIYGSRSPKPNLNSFQTKSQTKTSLLDRRFWSKSKEPVSYVGDCISPSRRDYYNANVETQPKYLCSNSTSYRNDNFIRTPSINSNHLEYKRVYSTPPPPPPPPPPPHPHTGVGSSGNFNSTSSHLPSNNRNVLSESQNSILLAQQMRNRNISPPCYEIAKMYSTKAALFENNRTDQLKTN